MRRSIPFIIGLIPTICCLQIFAQDSAQGDVDHAHHGEEDHSHEHETSSHGESATGHGEGESPDSSLQKQKLEIGLILTACILLLGLFLVVSTLIYGRRTRRQLATGRGDSQPRDELWYLKNEKTDESQRDESQEDTK